MSRIFFNNSNERSNYFSSLKTTSNLSWNDLAIELNVSERQLRDWRKGINSFPSTTAEIITSKYKVILPTDILLKEEYWHIPTASKLGGKRHFELYGPPQATFESRRKGGLNSLQTHRTQKTGFILRKKINIPSKNEKLAELIGALIGDGHISTWQIKIFLNAKTDQEYSIYLKKLIEELFQIKAPIYHRNYKSVLEISADGIEIVTFFNKVGLPKGNKIKHNIDIPNWIYKRRKWQIACIRGLLDTNGCTYIDHHKYKNTKYGHIGIAFTSYAKDILISINKILQNLAYNPTITTKNRVLLRREKDVLNFFREFKPSNSRHDKVLKRFLEEYRSGYNGTVSKAVVV